MVATDRVTTNVEQIRLAATKAEATSEEVLRSDRSMLRPTADLNGRDQP